MQAKINAARFNVTVVSIKKFKKSDAVREMNQRERKNDNT
jgi:hypothetical protein